MTGYTAAEKFRYWLFQDKIPLVKILILSNILTFLAIALFKLDVIALYFSYNTQLFTIHPWTVLTYPLVWVTMSPISLLFSCYWLWIAGGSLERAWGTRNFGVFFFQMAALSAGGLFLGWLLTGVPSGIYNLWVPLAGLTVAFAMLNPEQQIMFMLVIPLKLKYLAMLSVGLLAVSYGAINLALGLFVLAGCAYAYWRVRRPITRLSAPRGESEGKIIRVFERRRPARRLNPFAAMKEREEQKRLKELFERSFGDDENDERGRR